MARKDVEKLLRDYRDAGHRIAKHRRKIAEIEQDRTWTINNQKARFGDNLNVKNGLATDPVFLVFEQAMNDHDRTIIENMSEIGKIREYQKKIDDLLNCLETEEEDILRWKYVDCLTEPYILSNLQKQYKHPIGRRRYYDICGKILDKLDGLLTKP